MARKQDWKAIEADFRAGVSLADIRSKHGVRLDELMARARAGGWTRGESGGAGKPPGDPPPHDAGASEPERPSVVNLTVLADREIADAVAAAEAETLAQVVDSHKRITRGFRERLDRELEEFDGMCAFFATFRDSAHIAKLRAQPDDGAGLREYLTQALAHFRQRDDAYARLVQSCRLVVDLERAVWGLDKADGGGEKEESYDDLLDALQKPVKPLELPANVLQFEERVLRNKKKSEERG